ncbi:MAG: hypothetical protein J6W30_04160 [Bacteroidales bacterium]|nr:hypothetical protein [Bacteroidales bacterium]
MEIGELRPLREMAVCTGSVFRMRFYPQDGVVPKEVGDTSRDKYFVILGKDNEGGWIALSLINTEINENLKQRIGKFQYRISSAQYEFLNGKDRFVDCYDMKEVASIRIVDQGDYTGLINETDLKAIIKLVNDSPIASVAKLKRYEIYVG